MQNKIQPPREGAGVTERDAGGVVKHVLDAHLHYRGKESVAHFLANLAAAGIHGGVLLNWRGDGYPTDQLARTLKDGYPGRFYLFDSLVHDAWHLVRSQGGYLAAQLVAMKAAGYDGLKMMEGSPYYKKALPHPLDHAYYQPLWNAAENEQFPITLHLANPQDCWWTDAEPELYRHAEPQEEYFRQAEAVLAAHPRLRINFAHFMFMGPRPERLDRLFSRYPELRVDLAMGHEYMYYLCDDLAAARQFFIKWQDRILYGTDLRDANSTRLARAKAEQVRLFLEHDGPFESPTAQALGKPIAGSNGRVELRGMKLPLSVLEKILRDNLKAWVGATPRPLSLTEAPAARRGAGRAHAPAGIYEFSARALDISAE